MFTFSKETERETERESEREREREGRGAFLLPLKLNYGSSLILNLAAEVGTHLINVGKLIRWAKEHLNCAQHNPAVCVTHKGHIPRARDRKN